MKISKLASELINIYGDIEVVEILHIDDTDSPEPYGYEEVTTNTLKDNTHVTELLKYCGHNGEKHFVTANMRGYIDGAIEKALLLDFSRYVEDEEED